MTQVLRYLCLFLILPMFSIAAQDVYKWKDDKGQWHFSQGPSSARRPALRLVVERVNYKNGYLRIEGTVENISQVDLNIPRLNVKISDPSENMTFNEQSVWPAGGHGKKIGVRQSAVFTTLLSVPDKAKGREVQIDVSTDDYPAEVEWKQSATFKIW
jgi:hypothetical protein